MSERLRPETDRGCGTWPEALTAAGIELVVVPDARSRARLHRYLDGVGAVVLSDGNAGSVPGAGVQDGREAGPDRTERELLRHARAHGLPVVGIGHGAAFLLQYFGGRAAVRPATEPRSRLRFVPGRGPESATVRPTASAGCDPATLPAALTPIAFDEHERVAGFVHRTEPILGVHWLPVDPDDGASRVVLDALRRVDARTRAFTTER